MHSAEDQQDHTHLVAQQFDGCTRRADDGRRLQREGDEADVDQVEAHDQQVIDRVGELGVAMKSVDEKDGSPLVKGAGNPYGQADTDQQINQVGYDDDLVRGLHNGLLGDVEHVQNDCKPARDGRQGKN